MDTSSALGRTRHVAPTSAMTTHALHGRERGMGHQERCHWHGRREARAIKNDATGNDSRQRPSLTKKCTLLYSMFSPGHGSISPKHEQVRRSEDPVFIPLGSARVQLACELAWVKGRRSSHVLVSDKITEVPVHPHVLRPQGRGLSRECSASQRASKQCTATRQQV